ncbi:putative OsmC-like protein [Azospirillum agricola]|uniref:OsmC family protein n=1 Tax=Azospirillum agricola TaxID=1720247 RepID=UPI001AE5EE57|nr:OsmC family protein [Azospirillum agricola]MBP2231647.1 putative OsmC-like protein [Azospirillum agricola]
MKNGINVAAVSELVHEIRKVPGENEILYGVGLEWLGGLTMEIRTLPLRFGSKRLGRDFAFRAGHHADPSPEAPPTPADYFMTGLGACVANILVQGASYKGITIDRLRVEAAARRAGSRLADLSALVTLTADGSWWQYKQMMMNVARFSPNYITVTLPNAIGLDYRHLPSGFRSGGLFATADGTADGGAVDEGGGDAGGGDPLDLGVDVAWRNATQFDVTLRDRRWRQDRWSLPARFPVDQPVPAAGLNEAPNPQEYILAAVVADLAQQLVLVCRREGRPLRQLSATMRCRLDMKGCFNLFDKSAVQLQDNRVELSAVSDNGEAEMRRFLRMAQDSSACWQAFVNATPAALERAD